MKRKNYFDFTPQYGSLNYNNSTLLGNGTTTTASSSTSTTDKPNNFWNGLFGFAQSAFGASRPQVQPQPVVEDKKSNTGLIVGVVLAVFVVSVVLYFTLRK